MLFSGKTAYWWLVTAFKFSPSRCTIDISASLFACTCQAFAESFKSDIPAMVTTLLNMGLDVTVDLEKLNQQENWRQSRTNCLKIVGYAGVNMRSRSWRGTATRFYELIPSKFARQKESEDYLICAKVLWHDHPSRFWHSNMDHVVILIWFGSSLLFWYCNIWTLWINK